VGGENLLAQHAENGCAGFIPFAQVWHITAEPGAAQALKGTESALSKHGLLKPVQGEKVKVYVPLGSALVNGPLRMKGKC
jgi:hypothetical protein